jgi:hypothetical protein
MYSGTRQTARSAREQLHAQSGISHNAHSKGSAARLYRKPAARCDYLDAPSSSKPKQRIGSSSNCTQLDLLPTCCLSLLLIGAEKCQQWTAGL